MFRKPITSLPTNDIEMQVVDWTSYDMDEIEENLDDSDDSDKSEHKKMSEKMFNIKAYGLNADGQSVCVHINEFTPYFFFKIPQDWSKSNVTELMTELNSKVNYYAKKALISSDIVMRKEFYGFTNDTMFKFVRLVFKNYGAFCQYRKHLEEPIKLNGKNYTFQLYESKIAPLLRFLHCRDVIPAAWIKIGKGKYDYKDITRCQIEISANWKDIQFLDKSEIGPIMIASFDIECTSTDGSFPVASRKGDQVIQIGTTVHKNGETECFLHHIVTLKTPEEISKEEVEAENLIVEYYDDERSVILAWAKFIDKLDPDIITGYNIWGFDMPYLYNRVKNGNGGETFDYSEVFFETLARCKDFESKGYDGETKTNYLRVARYVEKGLSSSALGDNTLKFFEIEGVVGIDLMKVVQRDHKLDSFKLDKVAEVFLGLNKIDLPPRKIFENYRDGSPAKIKEIAVYCLKDCVLVNKLMMKLNILPNNIGMANVCCVPLSYIFLRGQGIKIFSLIAKECRKENYLIKVVESDPEDKTSYEGAIVFEPKPGIYFDPIAVNDYASLYPSSMIAENLSHDSLVWVKIFDNYDRLLKLINGYGDVIEEYDIDGTLIKKSGNLKYMGLEEYNYNEIKYDNFEKYDDKKHKLVPKKFIIKAKPDDKVLTGYTICCFVEKKDGSKSLLPRILQKLLKARKDTRKKIEYRTIKLETGEEYSGLLNEDKTEIVCEKEGNIAIDPTTIIECKNTFTDFMKTVWDSLQLSYKISANSLYGDCGNKLGSVANKYVAASCTRIGRGMVIMAKNKTLEKFPEACIIYGDTDSIFINFMPFINKHHSTEELTEYRKMELTAKYCTEAAAFVSSLCKPPHNLNFEKILYPFIIFSKKRYVSNKYEGSITQYKQNSMGIALKRRDSAPILKDIYGGVIKTILNERDINKAKQFFKDEVNNLLSGNVDIKKLIVSKSLKGNYANPTTIAHKVLADRMGERDPGNKPMPSDRIPYCYIDICNLKCHQCNAGNLRADNCKCVKCMQLFCSTHLHNHRKICKTLCRFCKKTKPSNEIKECKTCKGWYCPEDMVKHTIRTDKYKMEHFDKCKKPLEQKILQGDILENPDYIKEKGLIIDYKYYLDHQIETHCMQLFGLTMDNPESLIASAIRKYNNNKSGNQEISKWFAPLSTPTPEILQSTVPRTVQSLHPMTLRIKKKKIEDTEAQSITQWTQTTNVDDNEEIVNDSSNVKIL
jgi:DNA polymerase elongation subunit (family B)